jgi:CheY-like chemotaxis protein
MSELRILVLNDEEEGLILLRHALTREFPQSEVLNYSCAEDALNALQTESVDAVITDNRMPKMTGIDFVRRLRAQGMVIPIVMLTGSEEKKSEAIAAGVTTFISSGSWADIRRQIRSAIQSVAAS